MFEFLSYGAGVNSTAVLVLLNPQNVVFSDTGNEWPETYEYIREVTIPFCQSNNLNFIVVRNKRWTLEEMSLQERVVPARQRRWCSDKFKIRVITEWLEENGNLPCRQFIGFDANESHRAKPSGREDILNEFPLIERGLDRPACVEVIRNAGLHTPSTPKGKSGCFFCPFQGKNQWITLKQEHPNLFERAVEIERNASGFDRGFYLAGDAPLEDWIKLGKIRFDEDQYGLFQCACYNGTMTEPEEVPA